MATFKELFATAQSMTITLDSLANTSATAGQQSTYIDNTTNLYLDALVQLKIVNTGTTATGIIEVYAYGSIDGGTTYGDTVTGSNGVITLTNPPILNRIGVIPVPASTTYYSNLMSVASAFNNILPPRWGIVVLNKSGAALGTGCTAQYIGVQAQSA